LFRFYEDFLNTAAWTSPQSAGYGLAAVAIRQSPRAGAAARRNEVSSVGTHQFSAPHRITGCCFVR